MIERWLITGRVQGVGYRDWLCAEARARGVEGWVRNRGVDQVEAVVSGEDEAVEALARLCHRGPPAARVETVHREPHAAPPGHGFRWLPSV